MLKKLALTSFLVFAMSFTVFAEEGYIVKMKSGGISLFSVNENEDMEKVADSLYTTDKETAEKLLESGKAEYIEPDSPLELYDIDTEPNDPYYSQQVYMSEMKIPAIQKLYSGKVKVGIIDSGINKDHPDLQGANIIEGYNFVDENTDTSDTHNHGTRVASVIAARPNNGIGVAGIAPDCTIVPFVTMMEKTVDDQTVTVGNTSHLIKAINSAVNDYGCKVLNISLGTSDYSKSLESAVNNAANKGVIIVAAAGNGGTNEIGVYNYPASFDNVISVGAVLQNYSIASYSQRNDKVDVSAVYIRSMLPNNTDGYSSGAGTSFAAPVITGITALVVSDDPNMDVYTMKQIIAAATADANTSGYDYSGYGVLMCDEIEHVRNYNHDVFVSPIVKKNTVWNLKLLSNGSLNNAPLLIKAKYKDGVFVGYTSEEIGFDENGIAWTTAECESGYDMKFFVWDSLDGQKSLSDVR